MKVADELQPQAPMWWRRKPVCARIPQVWEGLHLVPGGAAIAAN